MKFELTNIQQFQLLNTLDLHTEGEPLRIITSGYPEIQGNSILEKRRFVENNLDHLRQALMFEPRGHADMYGAIITQPCTPDGDFGILFMHNEGYSSMCGHGIIAAVTAGVQCCDIKLHGNTIKTIRIDSPAGRIKAYAQNKNQQLSVSFDCVPSFVEVQSQTIVIEGYGEIQYDIAFGGAYYAYIDADIINLSCDEKNTQELISLGRKIKQAVINSYTISHPEYDDLSFLYGVIFTSSKTTQKNSHSRHVCIFADGEVDRSPTGTGVSGRIALLYQEQSIELNQVIRIESIISSSMTGYAHSPCLYFDKSAVTPNVSGKSYITGRHEFLIDHNDPHKNGFILR